MRRGGCSPRQQRRFIAAPAKPVKVPSAAHVAHPSMTHRVAQDETLWDLAMRYGVTMKSIRAVNGIPEDTYVIIPGQVLVLPIQSLDKKAPASWVEDTSSLKDPSLASKNWLWTGKDAAVKHTSTVELANLLDPPEGTNPLNHDTVVVAYMPDCKHCQDLEPVVCCSKTSADSSCAQNSPSGSISHANWLNGLYLMVHGLLLSEIEPSSFLLSEL